MLHAGFLLGLLFSPADGSDMFLQNISQLSPDYTVFYPKRQNYSVVSLLKASGTDMLRLVPVVRLPKV
jgi:hypothetical protein